MSRNVRKFGNWTLASSFAVTGFLSASVAHAAVTINVNTTADNTTDNGLCSLREAVYSANQLASLNGDCVAGSSTGTIIKLGSSTYTAYSAFEIYAPVTIRGNGVGSTTIRGSLSASDDFFFGLLYAGGTVTFEKLTVDGNALTGNTAGISAYGDFSMYLQEAAVRDFTDSGVRSNGVTVILDRSSVFGNTTPGHGGGVFMGPLFDGAGALGISQSAIHDNYAENYGGGIYFTGAGNNQWSDSTISSNTAGWLGGGVFIELGAGGQYVQVNRSTIANNDAWRGGGFEHSGSSLGNVHIYDSIIGDNTADTSGTADGSGTISNSEYTLFETSSGISFITSANLILGSDPRLDPLQTWPTGIPTKVHPLRSTSPARNVKSWSGSTVDQRGLPRGVGTGTNRYDIGAFERQ
jgi:CSLREA domain-containing protein